MLNSDFDPYEILQQLNDNQMTLNNNQSRHAEAIRQIVDRLNQQQQLIDGLVKHLNTSNKANEILIERLTNDLQINYKDIKNG